MGISARSWRRSIGGPVTSWRGGPALLGPLGLRSPSLGMSRRVVAGVCVVVFAAVVTAGCSSGASGTGSVGTSVTTTSAPPAVGSTTPTATSGASSGKVEFLLKGNAICAAMNAQQLALDQAQGPNGPSTPEAAATYLDANEAITSSALAQLKALPQPDDPLNHRLPWGGWPSRSTRPMLREAPGRALGRSPRA